MANRNGLNHKVRGFKGVGWNRALPAAFGFGNGIKPDGINDYMTVPRLIDLALPNKITIELWTYKNTMNNNYCFSLYDSVKGASLNFTSNGAFRQLRFDSESGGLIGQDYWLSAQDNQKAHCTWVLDRIAGTSNFYLDGILKHSLTSVAAYIPDIIKIIYFFRFRNGGLNSNYLIDEFRIHSTTLRQDEVLLNYNGGMGNNPCLTEHLMLWYKFDSFEMLDFSSALDGSDIRLGIRDYSGNNYHGYPINMDTDPVSGNYVLKPF